MNKNAREVLIFTEKAQLVGAKDDVYAATRDDGVLCWYDKDGTERVPVALHVAFRQDWQPYHEVKEISPEEPGELWRCDDEDVNYMSINKGDKLILIGSDWFEIKDSIDRVIHGKNKWTRIYPPVEESHVKEGLAAFEEACSDDEKPFVMDEMSARAADRFKKVSIDTETLDIIEINRVEWDIEEERVFPVTNFKDWKSLIGRPPMKMILLMAKEQHECQS